MGWIRVQITVARGASVQLHLLPQLGPLPFPSASFLALAPQVGPDRKGILPDVAEHLGLLAGQRRGGQLEHRALHVAREVHHAEHGVVLGVDGGEPPGDVAHGPGQPIQLCGVHVLDCQCQARSAFVARVENDVLILATDAQRHHVVAHLRALIHHRLYEAGVRVHHLLLRQV
ncbi:hypothetical protein D3C78_1361840 [compost metagenome]